VYILSSNLILVLWPPGRTSKTYSKILRANLSIVRGSCLHCHPRALCSPMAPELSAISVANGWFRTDSDSFIIDEGTTVIVYPTIIFPIIHGRHFGLLPCNVRLSPLNPQRTFPPLSGLKSISAIILEQLPGSHIRSAYSLE
jgi:hypothetical protein